MDEIIFPILSLQNHPDVSPDLSLGGCVLGMLEIKGKVLGDGTKGEKGRRNQDLRKRGGGDILKRKRGNTSQERGRTKGEEKNEWKGY